MMAAAEERQRSPRHNLRQRALKHKSIVLIFLVCATAGALSLCAAQSKSESPLNKQQVEGLVEGGVYSGRIAKLVEQRGIDFKPTESYLRTLREEGAKESLIRALLAARVPAASSASGKIGEAHASATGHNEDEADLRGAGLARDLALAEQLERQKMWPQAEQEYRAALNLEPNNASMHVALGRVLAAQKKPKEAIDEYREGTRLQPDLATPHVSLGDLLVETGDVRGAVSAYREALRLSPNDPDVRGKVAKALYSQGDLKGAVAEYRALQGLKPNDPDVHYRLGLALYADSNLSGAAAEFRQALRLEPNLTKADAALGDTLLKQGDRYGALEEYRKAAISGDPALRTTFDWLSRNLAH